ncbi:MAG: ATP-binding cassette domain-containing protein [Methylicorpusculum sp.]|nr:ATP-binding cassette domain-containing protein [Methylicorpusculum sp.]
MNGIYELHDIRFAYDDKTVLSLPELWIHGQQVTALIGPNGCGKSTLLNILSLTLSPQQGEVVFMGEKVSGKNRCSLIRKIGYLPQNPFMFRGTVKENLLLALKFHGVKSSRSRQKIDDALAQFGIGHLVNHQANSLSGGELQKTALARALITEPDVLLMDEPFNFLDHSSNQLMEQFISGFISQAQQTLIFSTHNRLQGLALAGPVISLVQGAQVDSPLINLFGGFTQGNSFDTGKLLIRLPGDVSDCRHISIDPHEIVLSRTPLISSIRNQFPGRITSISEEAGKVCVEVSSDEKFLALITHEALQDLDLRLGEAIWVNFKSNSIVAF